MKFFFVSLLVLGYVGVASVAASAGSGEVVKVSVVLPKQNPGMMIRFEETPTRVLLESVCTNYPPESLDNRQCRAEAKGLFGARCFSATQAFNGSSQDPVLKAAQKKWCDAGKSFKP